MIFSLLFGLSSTVTFDGQNLEPVRVHSLSLSYPVYVRECSLLIPEKKGDFSSALKGWIKRNKKQIKAGRTYIRQAGLKSGKNTIAMTDGMADLGWRMIADTPEDVRKNICLMKLKEMSA